MEKNQIMYYVVDVFRWCVALQCQAWMRLTFQRDYLPEREVWRDFLVSTEILTLANA